MRKDWLIMVGVVALLGGCGKGNDKAANAGASMSREEVATQVDKVQMKPGQWEGSFMLDDIEMPGMPPAASDQMKAQMKTMMHQNAVKHCVTPQQAANPSAEMLSGQRNKSCTYKGFDMSGGKIRGHIHCDEQGRVMTATMTGTYAADHYEIGMDMQATGGPQGGGMTMKARTQGKWLAAQCTDKQE